MDEHVNVKTIILQLAALFAALGVIYLFLRLPDIASRKEREIVELKEITVTVPEGVNIRQIGEIFEKNGMFSKKVFLGAAESDEGYLFPDTYRFYKDATPQDAVLKMKENFLKKITPDILGEIAAQ
ncbi:MAG: putative periplasmic solute-binding protein, partial [Parcubacteria group bacterium GW2011_GWA2_44_13]